MQNLTKAFNRILFLILVSIILCSYMLPRPYTWVDLIQRLLFSFILMGCLYVAIHQVFKAHRSSEFKETTTERNYEKAKLLGSLLTCLALANLIISIRYMVSFNPQGYDTPFYVYSLRSIYLGKFGSDVLIHPLVIFLLTPLAYIFRGDPISIGIAIPFFMGSIFSITIFASFYILRKSITYSSIVTIFSVMNFFFIRLTYDLYAQALFVALFYLVLVMFTRLSRINDSSQSWAGSKSILVITIILPLLLLIDPTSSAVVYLFLAIAFLVQKRTNAKFNVSSKLVERLFIAVASAVVVIILFMFLSGYAQNLSQLYLRILGSELSILKPQPSWEWIVYSETLPILILCALSTGFLILDKNMIVERDFVNLLVLWTSYLLFLIFITGYVQSYRIILFMPFSIIAANGVYSALNRSIFSLRIPGLKGIKVNHVLGIGLMVVVIVALIPSAYLKKYEYFPREEVSVLSDLASRYGFNSPDVTYIAYKKSGFSPYWYNVYLGKNVFLGNIAQLLTSNISTSMVISHVNLYPLDGLIRLLAEPLGNGIYLINTTYLDLSRMQLYERWKTEFAVSYTEYPMNVTSFRVFGSLNVTNSDYINLTFNDVAQDMLVGGLTRRLPAEVRAREIFTIYEGNNGTIGIEFYRTNNFVSSTKIYAITNHDPFSLVTLTNEIIFDEYRIIIRGTGTSTIQALKLKLISFGTSD